MNPKDPRKDSGSYVNGQYTTKNGFTGLGLNCPKGTRLYDTSVRKPIFFAPEDRMPGEEFRKLTPEVAPDIMPYYAISNYGRIENIMSGKVMKPNYRPNGYEYYCLAAENCKYGQKKYNTNRLVMKTFEPIENADELQVNHINGNKSENYVNKIMPDGSIQSNLEWSTPKENMIHRNETGLSEGSGKLDMESAKHIRDLHDQGYSYNQIRIMFYPQVSGASIQNICCNKTYKDPDYIPSSFGKVNEYNPANIHKLTNQDVDNIKRLRESGFKIKEIKERFYPSFSECTISDVIRGKTHNN